LLINIFMGYAWNYLKVHRIGSMFMSILLLQQVNCINKKCTGCYIKLCIEHVERGKWVMSRQRTS